MSVVVWLWTWRILGSDKETAQEGDENPLILCYFFTLSPALALDVPFEAVDGAGMICIKESKSQNSPE